MLASNVQRLQELPDPVPAVNQIEIHPWCQQREIVAYCQKNGIALQAYCPLARCDEQRLGEPKLVHIAEKHGKEPTQVLLRWGLQKG
jgi:diketogulonate reductase-like aldo/keto reductase